MLTYVLAASWMAGLLVPVLVRVIFSGSVDWDKQLSGPSWDFTGSWASNMTAAGTVLSYGVLLSCLTPNATLYVLPKRETYLSIGAIAGGLSVLAPLAFHIMSRILQACRRKTACSFAFLISAGITIWGLTLQLLVGGCLVWELYKLNTLPHWVATALLAFVLALSGLLVWYAILTAADTLKKAPPVSKEARPLAELQAPLPTTWHLL
jgi:hypothetical protein